MSRYYELPGDDRSYVSVTTFLDVISKPFLLPWAAKMERILINLLIEQGYNLDYIKEYLATDPDNPKKFVNPFGYQSYTDSRADIGATVHKAIDYKLKKLRLPKMTKTEKKVYDKWLAWWEAQKFELLGAERVVYNRQLGYAGTLDALVRGGMEDPLHQLLRVIDWKTGKGHYPEHILQNFAYQEALNEEGEVEPTGGLLVYIPSQPDELDKPIYTKKVEMVTPELMKKVEAYLNLWRIANNKPWIEKEAA
jgi:hypothetical protein